MKGVIREVKAPKGPDKEIKDRLRLIIEDGKSRFEWYDEKFFNHIDVLLLRCFFLSDIINTGNIKKISGYGYSLDWLFRGVGEMRISDKEEEIDLDKLAAEDVKEVKKSIEYKNSIHQQENERLRRELDNFKRLAFKLADVTYQKEPIHLPNH